MNRVSGKEGIDGFHLNCHCLPIAAIIETRLNKVILDIDVVSRVRLETHDVIWPDGATSSPLLNDHRLPSSLVMPSCLHSAILANIDMSTCVSLQIHNIA